MRARHREAAVMADETLAKPVIDQPGIADRAGKTVAAGAAQGQRGIATAIEKQERLLAPLDRRADLLGQSWRDEAPPLRRFAAQIDRLDLRHVLAAKALRQHDALIARLARVHLGLDRRRRRGQ